MDVHCMKHGLDVSYLEKCCDYKYQGFGILIALDVCLNCVHHVVDSNREKE